MQSPDSEATEGKSFATTVCTGHGMGSYLRWHGGATDVEMRQGEQVDEAPDSVRVHDVLHVPLQQRER